MTRTSVRLGERVYSDYPLAPRISAKEWCAFLFLVTGLVLYGLALVGGAAWVIWKMAHLWH